MKNPRAKTEQDYRLLAEKLGYQFLGPMTNTVQTKTSWVCEAGHTFLNSYGNLRNGRHCYECGNESKASKMRLSAERYHELATERNCKWLGTETKTVSAPTKWLCEMGHEFESSYNTLRKSVGCIRCSTAKVAENSRLKSDDYERLAVKKGYQWLGPAVHSALSPTNWVCSQNHELFICYNWVQQYSCKECSAQKNSKDAAITKEELLQLAQKHGFEWIGPAIESRSAVTNWRCPLMHEWAATPGSIQKRWGCKICGSNRKRKKFRISEADYVSAGKKLNFVWIGPMVANTQLKTDWQCTAGHTWSATYAKVAAGRGCPTCAVNANSLGRQHRESVYYAMAEKNSFEWIGDSLPRNSRSHTTWRCRQGHTWSASLYKISHGRSCPHCSREKTASSQRLNDSDYHRLAAKRGIIWLGPLVNSRQIKTVWECPCTNFWEATFSNIFAGRGCPKCGRESTAKILRLGPDRYHSLAAERGWRWIGPEVSNCSTKTGWQCAKGHKMQSAYAWIKGGNGCFKCADMVNGKHVSGVQRRLAELLTGELNTQVGKYFVDIACVRSSQNVAIEYDSWYYHASREAFDDAKALELANMGWRVLQIKSNYLLPEVEVVETEIREMILSDKWTSKIFLTDWGVGPSFANRANDTPS